MTLALTALVWVLAVGLGLVFLAFLAFFIVFMLGEWWF